MGASLLLPAMRCLAESAATLDRAAQRRIMDWAVRHKEPAVLALLASRADLDDELDRELGAIGTLAVRRAWLARPGRPAEVILSVIESETRETAFLTLARTPGLSEEVAHAILSKCSGIRALATIATAPAAPAEVRGEALRRLVVCDGELNGTLREELAELLKGGAAMRRIVFTNAGDNALLQMALTLGDDDDLDVASGAHLLDIVEERVAAIDASSAVESWGLSRKLVDTARLARWVFDRVPELEGRAAHTRMLLGRFADLHWEDGTHRSEFRSHLAALEGEQGICGRQMADLRAAATGPDRDAASEALGHLLTVPEADQVSRRRARNLLEDLVCSGELHPDDTVRVLRSNPRLGDRLVEAGNVPLPFAITIAQRAWLGRWALAALEATGDLDGAIEAFLTDPATPVGAVQQLLREHVPDAPELMAHLPARLFSNDQDLPDAALALGAQLVLDRLGDDEARWVLFEELATDSKARLGELLDIVEAAHAP